MSNRHPSRGQYVLGRDLDMFLSTDVGLRRSESPPLNIDLFLLVYRCGEGTTNKTLTYKNLARYTLALAKPRFPLWLFVVPLLDCIDVI
jgi:hypothetical protein